MEFLPLIITFAIWTTYGEDITALVFTSLFLVGRIAWVIGYKKNPNLRIPGSIATLLSFVAFVVMCIYTGAIAGSDDQKEYFETK